MSQTTQGLAGDMVERVARVINERANQDYNAWMLGRDECLFLARAAIAVMREPTPQMVTAMGNEIDEDNIFTSCDEAWAKAIDAALGETHDPR